MRRKRLKEGESKQVTIKRRRRKKEETNEGAKDGGNEVEGEDKMKEKK